MGTNYYAVTKNKIEVECNCGFMHLIDERLHIGKNSEGWMFTLQIIPDKGILELDDWKKILEDSKIVDEYGNEITYDDMMTIILKPSRKEPLTDRHKEQIKKEIEYGSFFDEESGLLWHGRKGKEGNYDLEERDFS